MDETDQFDLYLGSQTGILKGVSVLQDKFQNIKKFESSEKNVEVHRLAWGDDEENEILVGLSDESVHLIKDSVCYKSYNFNNNDNNKNDNKNNNNNDINDNNKIKKNELVGLEKYNNNFVSCNSNGIIKIWSQDKKILLEKNISPDMCFMRQNTHEKKNIIATGGKENELRLWDLNKDASNIFTAKNVRNDWLNLRVGVWPLDASFIPSTNQIFVSTAFYQIRLYDIRAQRRPVKEILFGDSPIRTISTNHNHFQVVVGNGKGMIGMFDFRGKAYLVHKFKGSTGAIKQISSSHHHPIFAAIGYDRYLRIFNNQSKLLLYKNFTKAKLNCCLMKSHVTPLFIESNQEKKQDEEVNNKTKNKRKLYLPTEIAENIWEDMEVVETKTNKKKTKSEILKENKKNKIEHIERITKKKRKLSL